MMCMIYRILILIAIVPLVVYIPTVLTWALAETEHPATTKLKNIKTLYSVLLDAPQYKVIQYDARMYIMTKIEGTTSYNTVAAVRCRWFEVIPYLLWRIRLYQSSKRSDQEDVIKDLLKIVEEQIPVQQKKAEQHIQEAAKILNSIERDINKEIKLEL